MKPKKSKRHHPKKRLTGRLVYVINDAETQEVVGQVHHWNNGDISTTWFTAVSGPVQYVPMASVQDDGKAF